MTHISHSLHIGQPALQMAGKLKRDAGRGPRPQAHTHVEGQIYIHSLELLGMHKPASNVPCGLTMQNQRLSCDANCVLCEGND